MERAGTKTKYHLLGLLVALVVGGGLHLLVALPDAQAQATPPQCSPVTSGERVCINKMVSSNPVQVGESVTFTVDIRYSSALDTSSNATVTDVLPPGVEFQSADGSCTQQSQTVVCDVSLSPRLPTIINIEVIASECGTFANTATVETENGLTSADTEDFTVEGCPPPPPPGQQQPGQQQPEQPQGGGAPAPITQEGEQDSEAGEIDQSFDVS
jgi:uncharacterized repeat protein (TIGR01451 family)